MKKLTTEEFIKKAKEIHGNKYDYSKVKYINSSTKVCIICPKHGEFWQVPSEHLRHYGCKICGGTNKLTTEEFIEKARKVHYNKYDYSKVNYANSKTKVCIICPEHGEYYMRPNDHLNGQGCPKCKVIINSNKKRKSREQFIKEANEIHNKKYDYSKVNYINTMTKVCIICPEHGEFWQSPNSHLKGRGCPICKESKLEKSVRNTLEEKNIKYIQHCNKKELSFLGKQHLDFYLPEYMVAIECQGKQHFAYEYSFYHTKVEDFLKTIDRDDKKKKLCEENNIKLFYYSDKKYNENIITNINDILKCLTIKK